MQPSLWSRLREARIVRVALVYLGVSWVIIQVVNELRAALSLPDWLSPVAVILLGIGLIAVLATAWVQSHPMLETRQQTQELPGAWEVGLVDLKDSIAKGEVPHLTWGRSLMGGALAFLLLFGMAGLYVVIKDRGRSFAPREAAAAAAPGIAVVPFSVNSPDLVLWREGMVDLLSTNLDGVGGLRSVDSRTVLARWREAVQGNDSPDLETTLAVASRAGAKYAVIGSAVALGKTVRLSATAYEVEGARNLGTAQAEGPADSVMVLVDRLSLDVVRHVLETATNEAGTPRRIASLTTGSLPALKAYLVGESYYRRSDFGNAITAYREAVHEDSTFALAWSRLASAYGWAESIGAVSSVEASNRALRFVDRLPAREALLVRAQHDMELGRRTSLPALQDAVQKYPDDPELWYLLGDTYFHLGAAAMVPEGEVERAFGRAAALDPGFAAYYPHRIERALANDDTAGARKLLEEYSRLDRGPGYQRRLLPYQMVVADSAKADQLEAQLDTMSRRAVTGMRSSFHGPLGRKAFERLNRKIYQRPDATWVDFYFLTFSLLQQGRFAAARDLAKTDALATPDLTAWATYSAWLSGAETSDAELDEKLSLQPGDTTFLFRPLLAGVRAADRGRWAEHTRAKETVLARARSPRTAADSANARMRQEVASALDAYGLWRRGQTADAITRLSRIQQESPGLGAATVMNELYRVWLGEMMLEQKRLPDAARYFESLWDFSYADYRLGMIYEQLGEKEKAVKAYADFLTAWRTADPNHPRAASAREALQRLGVNR